LKYNKGIKMSDQEIRVNFNELPNIGVLSAQVPDNILEGLNAAVDKILEEQFKNSEPMNRNLLGHMRHEYKLDECIPLLESFVVYLATLYDQKWNWFQSLDENYNTNVAKSLKLHDLWVNVQQKHEFNPPHEHTGIMSFNIWLRIPYDLKEEEAYFPQTSGVSRTSKFSFHYANLLGQHSNFMVEVDKLHEGTIVMFPSKLNHSVNPFYTSDEYRISIAGNLRIV